jgi:hypothetical protein
MVVLLRDPYRTLWYAHMLLLLSSELRVVLKILTFLASQLVLN